MITGTVWGGPLSGGRDGRTVRWLSTPQTPAYWTVWLGAELARHLGKKKQKKQLTSYLSISEARAALKSSVLSPLIGAQSKFKMLVLAGNWQGSPCQNATDHKFRVKCNGKQKESSIDSINEAKGQHITTK